MHESFGEYVVDSQHITRHVLPGNLTNGSPAWPALSVLRDQECQVSLHQRGVQTTVTLNVLGLDFV
jgi:hypothetical protein